jgi:membrane-associated phospholipid phosphatase
MYGAATLTGVSRMYNNQHWASDVIAGAAIGTLTGIKVFRYQHSHPDNWLDRKLLRAGISVSNTGMLVPIVSVVRQ